MDPLESPDDLAALSDRDLARLIDELGSRRPGAPIPSAGIRPRRRPWTYRDIRRLERLLAEMRRRG
jgi:hypothetical protein